jgi:hypothetical protein
MYKQTPKEAKLHVMYFEVKPGAAADVWAKGEGRARAALDRVKGGSDFGKVAREMSDDAASKDKGGALGWKRKGTTTFGPTFEDKAFALKGGQLSDVIKTDRGYLLAKVDDTREGDLPFEKVAHDLGEEKLRQDRSAGKAKADAEAAMAKIKAGTKIDDLFPKEEATKDQDLTKNSVATMPKRETAAAAAKPDDPNAPKLHETGLFSRHGNTLEDVGVSRDATDAVFGPLKKGQTGGPYEVTGAATSYVILEVADRKDADMASFEKKRDDITRDTSATKSGTVMNDLARRRCQEARDAGKITANPELLSYGGDEAASYTPCTSGGMR